MSRIDHGKSKSVEFRAWASMMNRCKNEKCSRYKNYGGRGILVCDRWKEPRNFLADMGQRPTKDHSLDRIDNDGNYSPENCRWATRSQQQKNKQPYPAENLLPKGDDHWTRIYKEKARKLFKENTANVKRNGENNFNAKLTRKKADEMRKYFKDNPGIFMKELGPLFGVKRETARKVVRGISWK